MRTAFASMGPRSWDRGERDHAAAVPRCLPASMGPRSWDRGASFNGAAVLGPRRDNPAASRRCDLYGFNGAAVLGPRRVTSGTFRLAYKGGFNGAAVLGPRRERSISGFVGSATWLQWGRGLGTAERRALRFGCFTV